MQASPKISVFRMRRHLRLAEEGFRNASQVNVFSAVSSMGGVVPVKLFRLVPWSIEPCQLARAVGEFPCSFKPTPGDLRSVVSGNGN